MAESFPIKCRNCAEIKDVAANIDVVAPYECPLCGANIAISEAEDFELPCPAEVVVEEQMPEHLRLLLPAGLRPWKHRLMGVFFTFGIPILLGIILASLGANHRSIILTLGIFCCLMFFFFGSMIFFASTFIELSNGHITFLIHAWRMGLRYSNSIETIKCVNMGTRRSLLWPFHGHVYYTYVGVKSRDHRFVNTSSLETARYVTHTIRRQLKTMGHKLQDG